MAGTSVCKFYKYGFCRFRDQCRYNHVHEMCNNKDCLLYSCHKRHPRLCKFHSANSYCKFGSLCQFKHGDENQLQLPSNPSWTSLKLKNLDETIASLRKENEELKMKLEALDLKLLDLEEKYSMVTSEGASQVGLSIDHNTEKSRDTASSI